METAHAPIEKTHTRMVHSFTGVKSSDLFKIKSVCLCKIMRIIKEKKVCAGFYAVLLNVKLYGTHWHPYVMIVIHNDVANVNTVRSNLS